MEVNDPDAAIVPLNLIFDYPVRWSRFKVLRDFIQNFYDSKEHADWNQHFTHGVDQGRLWLRTIDAGFSYEWLLHIGASTKREDSWGYVGYFGEGFKIAALCALRDHGWGVTMASRDWRLEVTTADIEIDGRQIRSLAYRIRKGLAAKNDTTLELTNFSSADRQVLNSVLPSFYYADNPLFGECIWSGAGGAVWTRSKCPKPEGFPYTDDYRQPGIVFAGYQALGSLESPLIFCNHNYRHNDRERNFFFRMDAIEVVHSTVRQMPPESSAALLSRLSRFWYRYPRRRYDFESWYVIIRTLAQTVASSTEQAHMWRRRYPNLLLVSPVSRKDLRNYNRRQQALAWLHRHSGRYRLVQDGFVSFGYQSLESACDADGGFSVTRPPRAGNEQRLIGLLERTVNELYPGFFGTDPLPQCEIISVERAVWKGMAECVRRTRPVTNAEGIPIRFKLPRIALKSALLRKGCGAEVLSTYLHELCHMFGGDRSASFSAILTDLLEQSLSVHDKIQEFEQLWNKIAISETAAGKIDEDSRD